MLFSTFSTLTCHHLPLFTALSLAADILKGFKQFAHNISNETHTLLSLLWIDPCFRLELNIIVAKTFLCPFAVSFCGHLDHEKLRMLTRQSKKVAGPTPLQTDTPIDVAQWDCWKNIETLIHPLECFPHSLEQLSRKLLCYIILLSG